MKYLSIGMACVFILISCANKTGNNKNSVNTQNTVYTVPQKIDVVEAPGEIMPLNGVLELNTDFSTKIKKVLVKVGEEVKEGQDLILLDNREANLRVLEAKAEVTESRATLSQAMKKLKSNKLSEAYLLMKFKKAEKLYKQSAIKLDEVLELKNQYNLSQIEVQADSANIEALMAQVQAKQEALKLAVLNKDKCMIKAPSSGRILSINVQEGDCVKAYTDLLSFAKNDSIIAEAQVDELFASKIKIGQKVEIKLIGYHNVIAKGTVYSMDYRLRSKSIFSGLENEKQDSQTRLVKILLDNQKSYPLIGTKVNCEINVK